MINLNSGKISLGHILRIFAFIIVVLIITGMGVGIARINDAKIEQSLINQINTTLDEKGNNDEVHKLVSGFMKRYSQTKNIIITDSQNNIVYSANKNIIGKDPKFVIEPDRNLRGISNLVDTNVKFITDKRNVVPHSFNFVARNRNYIQRNQMLKPGSPDKGMLERYNRVISRGDILFLNSFRSSQNGLSIYYISGDFRENSLVRLDFILQNLIRITILVFWILAAFWIFRDARRRRLNFAFWGIVTLLTGPIGILLYMMHRKNYLFCHVCGVKVEKDYAHCDNCGAKLKKECIGCENIINLDDKYCHYCGKENKEGIN